MKAYGYIAMSLALLMPPAAPAQIAAGSRAPDGQLLMTDAGEPSAATAKPSGIFPVKDFTERETLAQGTQDFSADPRTC